MHLYVLHLYHCLFCLLGNIWTRSPAGSVFFLINIRLYGTGVAVVPLRQCLLRHLCLMAVQMACLMLPNMMLRRRCRRPRTSSVPKTTALRWYWNRTTRQDLSGWWVSSLFGSYFSVAISFIGGVTDTCSDLLKIKNDLLYQMWLNQHWILIQFEWPAMPKRLYLFNCCFILAFAI